MCEQRMNEPHPGTVERDQVTVLSGAEMTPHVWSEQALEQVQRRIRQDRDGQQRPFDVGAESGETGIHDRLETRRQRHGPRTSAAHGRGPCELEGEEGVSS